VYQRIGDAAVMPILVDQMRRNPDSIAVGGSPPTLEPADKPP
jgi:hypothetical protein